MALSIPSFPYVMLNNKGEVIAASISLSNLMTLMSKRWAGKIMYVANEVVLFDIETDRNSMKQYPNAQETRAEFDLAWHRVPTNC